MKDKMRKAYQREFNKRIHALNKNIANDELWRGRFIFLQKDAHWWKFSDNSGGELTIFVRGYDKKTGYYKDFRIEFAPWMHSSEYKLWEIANKFIAEDSGVWNEEPRISINTAPDYTNRKVNVKKLMAEEYNFYISAEYFNK